jgi:hypothetical protein
MKGIGRHGKKNLYYNIPMFSCLFGSLRELGWIEGRTIAIEYRWAEGRTERLRRNRSRIRPAQGRCHCDRLPALAAELVRSQVAVLAATGGDSARPDAADFRRPRCAPHRHTSPAAQEADGP